MDWSYDSPHQRHIRECSTWQQLTKVARCFTPRTVYAQQAGIAIALERIQVCPGCGEAGKVREVVLVLVDVELSVVVMTRRIARRYVCDMSS